MLMTDESILEKVRKRGPMMVKHKLLEIVTDDEYTRILRM
jgi:hypothetical protein